MSDRRHCRTFVTKYLRQDGVFLLRLIGLNKDEIVVGELLGELWRKYRSEITASVSKTSDTDDDDDEDDEDDDVTIAEISSESGERKASIAKV